MLNLIHNNLQTLLKAIGNEPKSQILINAIRKIIGFKPVHIEERRVKYNEYLKLRNRTLNRKKIMSNYCETISIIMIDISTPDDFDLAYLSLLDQRVHPHQILVVSRRTSLIEKGLHVFATLESAITNVETDYIVFVQSRHRVHSCFIQQFMLCLKVEEADIMYCCYDSIRDEKRQNPQWLPQLNQHLLYSNNYIGNSFLVKRSFGEQIQWFKTKRFYSAYNYDFFFRAIDAGAIFYRIPDVLYSNTSHKELELIAERRLILQDHIKRNKWKGEVHEGMVPQKLRIKWTMLTEPLVSIIIPFRDKLNLLNDCLDSILNKTDYLNYEIILADIRSQEPETVKYIQNLIKEHKRITHVKIDMDFNFSAINNYAVSKCNGEYILFLNNDTEVISRSWLTEMVMEAQGPKVGVVGAKLLYENDTVQHAGVLYGLGHVAGHAFRHLSDSDSGHMDRASLTQEYLTVTGACLLTKRTLFDGVKGFDEVNLAIAYNDVDFCLKIYELGFKIIFTPYAKLYHFESKTRVSDLSKIESVRYSNECLYMEQKWNERFSSDLFYHPHLHSMKEDFRIRRNA